MFNDQGGFMRKVFISSLLSLSVFGMVAALSIAPNSARAASLAVGGVQPTGLIGWIICMRQVDTTTEGCIKDNLEQW